VGDADQAQELPEHFFRHEFGRLVAVLTRRFGVHRLEICEDAAQEALLRAVSVWRERGLPDDKSAWLLHVAVNRVLDGLRAEKRHGRTHDRGNDRSAPALVDETPDEISVDSANALPRFAGEIEDDLLRLLFVCADPVIPLESRLVLALRTLCGFSTGEIALRLFQTEAAVYKRLQRAHAALRERPPDVDLSGGEAISGRLSEVLQIIYLLFNEGYASAQPDTLIRRELCEEAVRLGRLLAEHPAGASPHTDALLAVMYLHAARFDARTDGAGGLLLLEEQDRTLWDRELIDLGLAYLHRAARGEVFSRYHVEAAIAVEHCLAPSFAATRWDEIVRLYVALDRVAPSPLNTLNRGIAIAEWQGPAAGLAVLEAIKPPGWLTGYYLWDATLGELYRRAGNADRARGHLERARDLAPTNAERSLIERRLAAVD
jgi:RNA polymerase sigma factor (sigma-70 family)